MKKTILFCLFLSTSAMANHEFSCTFLRGRINPQGGVSYHPDPTLASRAPYNPGQDTYVTGENQLLAYKAEVRSKPEGGEESYYTTTIVDKITGTEFLGRGLFNGYSILEIKNPKGGLFGSVEEKYITLLCGIDEG